MKTSAKHFTMNVQPKNQLKESIVKVLKVSLIALLGYGLYYINSLLPIITGYPAKYLCSAVFVSGRTQAEVEARDLNFSFIQYTRNTVDFRDSSVTSKFLWGKSKAIYREGFGSTLVRKTSEKKLRKQKLPEFGEPAYNQDSIAWPLGNVFQDTLSTIDREKLATISKKLMQEDAYNGYAFAFLVVHKGIPVVEQYQSQFNPKTRFLSWSMAKSFTNTLVGIGLKEGLLKLNDPVNIPEWNTDERSQITLNHLMQMQSGLQWNEDYGNRSDVTVMLYGEDDFAQYAYQREKIEQAGTKFYYSSGSSNIVSYLVRKAFPDDGQYYRFVKEQLFNKLGMPTAVFEPDPSGTLVGSSYIYATARDYARFGLLYLQDGVFGGERILPEGWVEYSTTPASDSEGKYGAMFWLNRSKFYPSVPEDMFSCNGHDGQRIFMIPSKELVVVLLGYSPKPDHSMDFDRLMGDILKAVE